VELVPNCPVLSLDVVSDSLPYLDREPNDPARIADETLGVATGSAAADFDPNLSIESCRRRPAASEHEAQIDGRPTDLLVVHGLSFPMRAQYLLRGIEEGQLSMAMRTRRRLTDIEPAPCTWMEGTFQWRRTGVREGRASACVSG
jgi:hypothetical protein